MNYFYLIPICFILIICINYVQHKLNFLQDINLKHKLKNSKKVPLSGGIFILLSLMSIKFFYSIEISSDIFILLFLFFVLGFFSDTKPNFIPIIRLILQFILILFFIYLLKLEIYKSNIFFIDKFLNNYYFNLIFTAICIIVLLNGSNFIDGVNTNLLGYFIIVLFFISKFNYILDINLVIIILFSFYIFNFFGKCFLGDNGVYVLTILISFLTIDVINLNNLNAIFAINLLWYPAFENLFSIIRRYVSNDKVDKADKRHLHSILYLILSKNKYLNNLSNSLSGIIITLYNFISIGLSYKFINNNQILVSILIVNITIYLLLYFKLLNNLSNRSVSNK